MPNPHYTYLVKAFRISKPLCDGSSKLALWRNTVAAVANTLTELDPNFKHMTFLTDCEYHKD